MSTAMRIVVAGLVALALIVAHAMYRAWPDWFGAEIRLPVSILPGNPPNPGYVGIDFPAERLQLVRRGAVEPPAESFQAVHGIGIGIEGAAVRGLRGHVLFVQFVSMRPVSMSSTPVPGVTNLAGRVTRVDQDGRVWLNFGSHQLPVPPEVAARARPFEIVREPNRRPEIKYREPDPGTFAILRVLPSGRATLIGVILGPT